MLEFPRADFLVACLATLPMPVTVTITPSDDVIELNTGNNDAVTDILAPQQAMCDGIGLTRGYWQHEFSLAVLGIRIPCSEMLCCFSSEQFYVSALVSQIRKTTPSLSLT